MGDAWAAVSATAAGKHYGTSEDDIKAYAQSGGAVAGGAAAAAACSATGAGVAVSTFCASVGAEIGAAVAGVIVDLGASIFGSDDPNINDKWNPIADHAINVLVNVARKAKGLPVTGAPGGSARNWPEWNGIATTWARAANASAAARGSAITDWWYDGKNDPAGEPGRINSAAMNRFWSAFTGGRSVSPIFVSPGSKSGAVSTPALSLAQAGNALGGLGEDVVNASADTGKSIASGMSGGGGDGGGSSGSAVPYVIGALLLGGGGWWLWSRRKR